MFRFKIRLNCKYVTSLALRSAFIVRFKHQANPFFEIHLKPDPRHNDLFHHELKDPMRIITLMILLLAGLLLWTPDLSFERLKAFYETPQSELIKSEESVIFSEDQPSSLDNAPTLVLIHGVGASLQTWDEWTRTLKPHMRVVRFDLPGMGLSSGPSSEDYSDPAEIKRFEQFLKLKKIDHFILAGHDLGARLAWIYAQTHAEQVSHLVLLSPLVFNKENFEGPNAPQSTSGGAPIELPFYASLMRFTLPKWAVKIWLEDVYSDSSVITEQTLSRYHDMLLAPDVRKHLIERLSQIKTLDPAQLAQSIQIPTLLLWGEEDLITPIQQLSFFEKAIPGVKTVSFKNTGHAIQEENAPDSAQALLSFLKNPQSSELESKSGNNASAKPN